MHKLEWEAVQAVPIRESRHHWNTHKESDVDKVYVLDATDFEVMRAIAFRLQGGTDRERDEGHRLWLALNSACPMDSLQHPTGERDERD